MTVHSRITVAAGAILAGVALATPAAAQQASSAQWQSSAQPALVPVARAVDQPMSQPAVRQVSEWAQLEEARFAMVSEQLLAARPGPAAQFTAALEPPPLVQSLSLSLAPGSPSEKAVELPRVPVSFGIGNALKSFTGSKAIEHMLRSGSSSRVYRLSVGFDF